MLRDDVFQGLLSEGMPYTRIERLLDEAIAYGESVSNVYGIRVINTNSGMPAEYRIERIEFGRNLGVANYATGTDGTRYSITDEYSHYCGSVLRTGSAYAVTDKYGQTVDRTNPLYTLMVTGVERFIAWQAEH